MPEEEEVTVTLNRGDYTTCTINTLGASVTSWRFEDEEQLFVSRLSSFNPLWVIRGGIAFVYPHYNEWFFGPRHGFARNLRWKLEEGPTITEDLDVYVKFVLENNAYTESMWNYKFKLSYVITLCEKKLEFDISLDNLSKHFPFEFKVMHHSHFKIPDVTKSELIGLKDHLYIDLLKNPDEEIMEEKEILIVDEWTDKIYKGVDKALILTHTMKDLKLAIGREHAKDVNVWNPWDFSKKLRDLGDDEFMHFIAVEAGHVVRPYRLKPLTSWNAKGTLKVIEPEIIRTGHFYDLFDRYC